MKHEKLYFYLFIFSQNISVITFRFFQLLLAWSTLSITNSSSTLTVLVTMSWIANIIFLPISGYCLDKFRKSLIIFIANLMSLFLVVIFYLQFITLNFNFLIVIFITILLSISDSILLSSPNSIIPLIVKSENISKYTSISGILSSLQVIIGSIIGGGVIALLGISWSMKFIILFYLISLLLSLTLFFNKKISIANSNDKESFYIEMFKGFHVLQLLTPEKILCCMSMICNFIITPLIIVILPIYIKIILDKSVIYLAIMEICFGLGIFVGSYSTAKFISYNIKRMYLIFSSFFIMGFSIVLFPFSENLYIQFFILFLIGVGVSLTNISMISLRALAVPNRVKARLESIIYLFCIISIPLGSYVLGLFSGSEQNLKWLMTFVGIFILVSPLLLLISKKTKDVLCLNDSSLKNYYEKYLKKL